MRTPARIAALVVLALALALVPRGAARAEEVEEPASDLMFETPISVGGRPFVLLGTGIRKSTLVFKVYAMALYVDEEAARRAFPALAGKAGGRTKDKLLQGDRSQQFVIWGDFAKIAVLRFVRNVEAHEIREAWEEGLAALLVESMPQDLRDRTRAFIDLFAHDAKKGDELRIQTWPDGRVEVDFAGAHKEAGRDSRLCRGIWSKWLGAKPISTELRKTLVERIDILGK